MAYSSHNALRFVDPGVWAYFPDPTGRHGYIVPDASTARRLRLRLHLIEATTVFLAGGVGLVATLNLVVNNNTDVDVLLVLVLAAVAALVLIAAMVVSRRVVLAGFVRVSDDRPLWARYLGSKGATSGSRVRLLVSFAALVSGSALLATPPLRWVTALILVAVWTMPAVIAGSWLRDRLRQ